MGFRVGCYVLIAVECSKQDSWNIPDDNDDDDEKEDRRNIRT